MSKTASKITIASPSKEAKSITVTVHDTATGRDQEPVTIDGGKHKAFTLDSTEPQYLMIRGETGATQIDLRVGLNKHAANLMKVSTLTTGTVQSFNEVKGGAEVTVGVASDQHALRIEPAGVNQDREEEKEPEPAS